MIRKPNPVDSIVKNICLSNFLCKCSLICSLTSDPCMAILLNILLVTYKDSPGKTKHSLRLSSTVDKQGTIDNS